VIFWTCLAGKNAVQRRTKLKIVTESKSEQNFRFDPGGDIMLLSTFRFNT
jgi:hypothetical protein